MHSRNSVRRWGQRDPVSDGNGYASKDKIARLRNIMLDKRGKVDNDTSAYVEATLEYGVELTRSEYRPLANRNWKVIQRFGVRVMRTLLLLIAVLAFLGWRSYETTNDIQNGRRNSVLEKCHNGQKFVARLEREIGSLPEPEQAKARLTEKLTVELVETIIGPINLRDKHCADALRKAGL